MARSIYSKFRRITTNHLYFPEIDGIRFLAIMLVILYHSYGYFIAKSTVKFTDNPAGYSLLNTFLLHGDRGVRLFFVLSGFILCLPFAHHYINAGKKPSLKRYYLRRLTRLEPPYFIAMTAIFLLAVAMKVKPFAVLFPSWLASLIYSHDLIFHHTPLISVVAWSLEVEIQFYILAPLLFSLLMLPKVARRAILCIASVAIILLQQAYAPPFLSIYNMLQYFLTGILLADIYVSDEASGLFNKPFMILLSMLLLAAISYAPIQSSIYAMLLFPFFIGILYYIVLKNEVVKKIFSYKFIPVIGGMCYSIYLLHYVIISIVGRFSLRIHITGYYLPNLFLQMVLIGIPVLLLSSIFYYYIERPFMSGKWLDMLMKKDGKNGGGINPVSDGVIK